MWRRLLYIAAAVFVLNLLPLNAAYREPSAFIRPAYKAARWYVDSSAVLVSGLAESVTLTYCSPTYIRSTATFDNLGVNIITAGTTNVQLALYNDNAGRPGTLIIASGSVVNTATGALTVAITSTQIVGPGIIWKCSQHNDVTVRLNANPIIASHIVADVGATNLVNAVALTALTTGLTTPGTFGTWPDLTSNTWTDATTQIVPTIAMKVVSVP